MLCNASNSSQDHVNIPMKPFLSSSWQILKLHMQWLQSLLYWMFYHLHSTKWLKRDFRHSYSLLTYHIFLLRSYKHAFILRMIINGFLTFFRAIFFTTVGVTELAVRIKNETESMKNVYKSYNHWSDVLPQQVSGPIKMSHNNRNVFHEPNYRNWEVTKHSNKQIVFIFTPNLNVAK
jgi:hypothetical protein